MRINIVGGGPAGLYFAILMKRLDAAHDITIYERDGPQDTFGWGIVFSDQTFSYLEENDHLSYEEITRNCETWDNVVIAHKDEKVRVGGNKFSGIGRLAFLNILHARCRDLGIEIRFHTNITDISALGAGDLLVGADGANSLVRRNFEEYFQPTLEAARNKYIWLGTRHLFHGLTLTFRQTEAGLFIAHSYKFDKTTSTFIVECDEETWQSAGFDKKSDEETCEYLARVFEPDLEGHALLSNNFVRWLNFLLVRNRRWRHQNIVLLGDALHTAHFSIGSGTKLALEDSIALAHCFRVNESIEDALGEFERTRKPVIDKYQEAALSSLLMFENADELIHLDPLPFAYKLMTRSKKIDYDKLKKRDPEFIAAYDRWRGSKMT